MTPAQHIRAELELRKRGVIPRVKSDITPCPCGRSRRKSEQVYGERCEDCWIAAQAGLGGLPPVAEQCMRSLWYRDL